MESLESETLDTLKSKYIFLLSEKQQLQANFDLIKTSWASEKNHYKTTIADLEKSSRSLSEKIRILEEKNVSTEERLLQFQKITDSEETRHKDLTFILKKIQNAYIMKKGILGYNIEKINDFLQGVKGELIELRKKLDFSKFEEVLKGIKARVELECEERKALEREKKEIREKFISEFERKELRIEEITSKYADLAKEIKILREEKEIFGKINEELKDRNEKDLVLINSQKSLIENLENSVKEQEEKLQKMIFHINSSENEEQNMKSQIENLQKIIEDYKLTKEKHLILITTQESELNTLNNRIGDLQKTNENLEKTIKGLRLSLEELTHDYENQRSQFEKKAREFEEEEKTKTLKIEDQQTQLKDYERRIKALTDIMKSFENSEELKENLRVSKEKIAELTNSIHELTEENRRKNIELTELKEMFFYLQENQQEELLKMISKSAENLLSLSKIKEQEKREDLNHLKIMEKEVESYKPSIRSPKLDLILQQQRSLIEQIKETTQRCNVKEFEISPLEEIKQEIDRKLQEKKVELGEEEEEELEEMTNFDQEIEEEEEGKNQEKILDETLEKELKSQENQGNEEKTSEKKEIIEKNQEKVSENKEAIEKNQDKASENKNFIEKNKDYEKKTEQIRILFEQRHIELLRNKRREIEGFLRTIEELEEDGSYLKEIINTKNFEIFYLKSELLNQRSFFGKNVLSFQQDFVQLKNYIVNIKLLTLKERDDFLTDFNMIAKIIMEKIKTRGVSERNMSEFMRILTEKSRIFEEKSRNIETIIEEKTHKTADLLIKIKRLQSVFLKLKRNNNNFNEKKNMDFDFFNKIMKLYKNFLFQGNIPTSEALKGLVFEEKDADNGDQLSLRVSVSELRNPLKKEELQGFVEIISVSLVRMVEISKIIAKILKNFLLIEHKFPAKYNKIKANFLRFVSFIEEYNDKILLFEKENEGNRGVLEKFNDGMDLLSLFIKEIFNYRSNNLDFLR